LSFSERCEGLIDEIPSDGIVGVPGVPESDDERAVGADRLGSAAASGGIQEETTILGVPCLTLRENTERPVTVMQGTNTIVGCDPQRIVTEALAILDGKGKAGQVPELWDGRAAERIRLLLAR